jgi:UV DNA damage endonuclease
VHGGKSGRAEALVRVIERLPENVRKRLVLENDEYAYSAAEILAISRRAGVAMVFDNLHHAVHEAIEDDEHPSFCEMVTAAGETWREPGEQIVHLSNGASGRLDPKHAEMISAFPSCYRAVKWIEVEAKGKEKAIAALREQWSPGSKRK